MEREEMKIRKEIIDERFIKGEKDMLRKIEISLEEEIVKGKEKELIKEKIEERDERKRKEGEKRYMVEKKVKEGKGGKREMKKMLWIKKYL